VIGAPGHGSVGEPVRRGFWGIWEDRYQNATLAAHRIGMHGETVKKKRGTWTAG